MTSDFRQTLTSKLKSVLDNANEHQIPKWDQIKEKPETYLPAEHKHEVGDIKNLTNTLTDFAKHSDLPTWGTLTGKPSAFPAASHKHEVGDIKNLTNALTDFAKRSDLPTWSTLVGRPSVYGASYTGKLTWGQVTGAPDFALHTDLPTWGTLTGKPSAFPAASHKHAASDLSGVLKSEDASRFIAAQKARGAIGGYETAEVNKGVSSVTISKESKDTTVLSNLSGTVNVTFTPAGADECCVKVVAFKSGSSKAVLKMTGARWADGEAPSWGNPNKTLVLTACFIGGEVILAVFNNNDK